MKLSSAAFVAPPKTTTTTTTAAAAAAAAAAAVATTTTATKRGKQWCGSVNPRTNLAVVLRSRFQSNKRFIDFLIIFLIIAF